MKTKQLSKKLVLNRETIADIQGGIVGVQPASFTYDCYDTMDTCVSCLYDKTVCLAW